MRIANKLNLLPEFGKQMKITIEFVGSLRHACSAHILIRDYDEGTILRELINGIIEEKPILERNLLDKQSDEQKPTALVLINGREISVLQGLSTALRDGDKVVFVPVVHGG